MMTILQLPGRERYCS